MVNFLRSLPPVHPGKGESPGSRFSANIPMEMDLPAMNLNKPFWSGVFLSFFGLLLAVEMLLRMTVPTGFWYRHFDFSGDMTSLAEIRDRLEVGAPPGRRCLLLGDSVLGASALLEHRLPQAREKTLSKGLARRLAPLGLGALSLGLDGMLVPDLLGLSREWAARPPEKILLLLNFRMFAKDFAEGPKALSRLFFLDSLPPAIQQRLAPDSPPALEARLSDRLYVGMSRYWFLFRETQMAKTLWYYPSQKDFFQRLLERVVGKNEAQSEIVEAALKQKTASYYQAYRWDPKALPLDCLERMLSQWLEARVQVTVVLTPQNRSFLGPYLDQPSFEGNRKVLQAALKPFLKQGLVFRDWSGRYPAGFFLDHCHLTPEGNDRYAGDLADLLKEGKP